MWSVVAALRSMLVRRSNVKFVHTHSVNTVSLFNWFYQSFGSNFYRLNYMLCVTCYLSYMLENTQVTQ